MFWICPVARELPWRRLVWFVTSCNHLPSFSNNMVEALRPLIHQLSSSLSTGSSRDWAVSTYPSTSHLRGQAKLSGEALSLFQRLAGWGTDDKRGSQSQQTRPRQVLSLKGRAGQTREGRCMPEWDMDCETPRQVVQLRIYLRKGSKFLSLPEVR